MTKKIIRDRVLSLTIARARNREAAYVAYGSELASTLRVIVNSLRHGRQAAATGKTIARFAIQLDRALLRADDVLRKVRDARNAF